MLIVTPWRRCSPRRSGGGRRRQRPVMLTLVAFFVSRGELLFVALSIMAIGAEFFFLILASRLYSATLTMIEYRAEKDLLIAELGTAKSISDESRRRAEEANLAKSRFLPP
jgi:two-component system cell cycle sensor histidine kinase PleC